jgi:hypothetical protein
MFLSRFSKIDKDLMKIYDCNHKFYVILSVQKSIISKTKIDIDY